MRKALLVVLLLSGCSAEHRAALSYAQDQAKAAFDTEATLLKQAPCAMNVGSYWRALGPVYSNVNAVALAKGAPHPFAAMLYIDFTLSKEGQTMRVEIGDDSARLDLAAPEKPKDILYLTERSDYEREFERWTDLSKRVFGKGKAPDAK
jgi:ABC-type Fe3+ transport system substrate-binding protein